MRCTWAGGICAGAIRVLFARWELLSGSLGGTQRSSTKKRCTRCQGKPEATMLWKSSLGVEPPETARVACSWEASACSSSALICCAQAAAAARGSWRVNHCTLMCKDHDNASLAAAGGGSAPGRFGVWGGGGGGGGEGGGGRAHWRVGLLEQVERKRGREAGGAPE